MDFENKPRAQKRVDRILAFRDELQALEKEDAPQLSAEQKSRLSSHHSRLLENLKQSFDTDSTQTEKKFSLGMGILTFLGGVALCASVYFFFYRIWGVIPTYAQVFLLVLAPIAATLGMDLAAKKETTLYYATLLGLLAFACFVLNLHVLGAIFNITPTKNALLVWGAFAGFLAYQYGLRFLLGVGLLCILGYLAATVGAMGGAYWLSFGERPENFIIAGAVMLIVPWVVPHKKYFDFIWVYRLVGLPAIFIAVLVLSFWGGGSYFFADPGAIETLYQIAGFSFSGITIWLGIRFRLGGAANLGCVFFTILLFTKFFDWWWDSLPKYLFFLVISLISIGLLSLFKRLRLRTGAPA